MLKKPWMLYVQRHSALTEKAQMLKEATLRDHAGWTMTSKMPSVYIHFFGGESSKSILEARGIIPKDKQASKILQTKECPNCREPNTPTAKFCHACRFVISHDGYAETVETHKKLEAKVNELDNLWQEQANLVYQADSEKENLQTQLDQMRAEIERLKAMK
jgi:hypothetical protein